MPTWNATGAKRGKTRRLRPKPAAAGKAGGKSGVAAEIPPSAAGRRLAAIAKRPLRGHLRPVPEPAQVFRIVRARIT